MSETRASWWARHVGSPAALLAKGGTSKPVLVCVGDSITAGDLSANWVRLLRQRPDLMDVEVVNAGVIWYVANLSEILRRLSTQTTARIAVIDLPPIGEDLTSDVNARVSEYNKGLREVAASFDIAVLPLHARLAELPPPDHRPAPYDVRGRAMLTAFVWGMILRRSWDSVAERNGLAVLSDHVHLADRAGAALSQLVADFATER